MTTGVTTGVPVMMMLAYWKALIGRVSVTRIGPIGLVIGFWPETVIVNILWSPGPAIESEPILLILRLGLGDGAARQDISHAHPPSRIKIGHDDEFLGPGWHLLESSASGAHFRWTSERAGCSLRCSRRSRYLIVRSIMANPSEYSRISLFVEGRRISTFEVPNLSHTQKIPLPRDLPSGPIKVELAVENPFVPKDALEIMDMRVLGIAVSSLEII